MSDTVDATPIRSFKVVVNDLSGGDNAARAHSRKHRCTISSSDDCTVPSALSRPTASCRKPRAERRASSDKVTFRSAPAFGPKPPSREEEGSPAEEWERSSVSRTISAPWKWVPEKADSMASIASSKLMRPSSSSSARSKELLSSVSVIMPLLFVPPPSPAARTAGEDCGSNRVGRDLRRNFSRWQSRPTMSTLVASSLFSSPRCLPPTTSILRNSFNNLPIISQVCTYKLCRNLL
mmetsp:Transcript_22206/g.39929  ORF Transcript_22206/g.39929 Transcript_22206/m.39929 type:complete len:236 (-) Transcript_22206:2122-2829(-)